MLTITVVAPLLSRAASACARSPAIRFLSDVKDLSAPFWRAPEAKRSRRLLGVMLALKLAMIWVCLKQNAWYNDFYSAIQSNNINAFWTQIGVFCVIAGVFVTGLIVTHWMAESIKLEWRDWMVRHGMAQWLARRAFFRMELNGGTSSPEQRMTEDMGLFAGQTLDLVVGFLDVAVSLAAFTSVLWGLSGTVDIAGFALPGTMVFAVFGYSIVASLVTHVIGRPLVGLHNDNHALEADFRFSLIRLRENAETVAFYNGEDREAAVLDGRWERVVGNFWSILRRERQLGWFTNAYGQFSIVVPFLLASPRYFAGQISFGQVMQVSAAFGAVQACLNFFITSYGKIAQWQAVTGRLKAFNGELAALAMDTDRSRFYIRGGERLDVRGMHLELPNRSTLISGVTLTAEPGEAVLLQAPSGTGKSTILRAIAGLWPYGRGEVEMAEGGVLFIPQKPYMPLGTLREALCYPAAPSSDDLALVRALKAVCLPHLISRLDETEQWSHRLSGGEQQRLAFARVLLNQPRTVFLDEATSALDEVSEGRMYELLRSLPARPTIVSIGHRSTLAAFHDRVINLAEPQDERISA